MRSRRLTVLIALVTLVGLAVWLVWLAGGSALEIDETARTTARNIEEQRSMRRDSIALSEGRSATLDPATTDDSTVSVTPYAGALPGTAPLDTTNTIPPEAAPARDRMPDRALLPRPVVDSTLVAVERTLDDRPLTIPVKGVRADELVDTYTASRSEGRTHNAIDIMAPGGTPVVATTTGTVIKLFQSERGGVTLYQLDPDGRTIYYYAHLAGYAPGIAEGKVVRQGELIGYVGDTGNAGPGNTHLHFEITIVENPDRFWTGTPVNPYPLLRRKR